VDTYWAGHALVSVLPH